MTILLPIAGLLGLAVLAMTLFAAAYIKRQGDSNIVLLTDGVELPGSVSDKGATVAHSIFFKNAGKQDGVLLDVRVSAIHTPEVHVEPQLIREGTNPSELGYWVANILEPGETCEGILTMDVGLAGRPPSDLAITLTYDEVGRSPMITKTADVKIRIPAAQKANKEANQ
ncbi:MAG: hypothetical protein ACYC1U_00110 [Candidatus Aquicultorales bacterium]